MTEAHLHYLLPDRWAEWSGASLLSADERARMDGFRLESKRREYALARALVRISLSRHAAVDPAAWRFGAHPEGRPFVESPGTTLDFNLAHTQGLIVCLVSEVPGLGVDAEILSRRTDCLGVATHFFAPAEIGLLRAAPDADRRRLFHRFWTLKESYLKARGKGLALPLDAFWFDDAEPPVIAFDRRRIDDDPAAWRFLCPVLSDDHACAVALRGAATRLRVEEAKPRFRIRS